MERSGGGWLVGDGVATRGSVGEGLYLERVARHCRKKQLRINWVQRSRVKPAGYRLSAYATWRRRGSRYVVSFRAARIEVRA